MSSTDAGSGAENLTGGSTSTSSNSIINNDMLQMTAVLKLSRSGWSSLTDDLKSCISEIILGNLPQDFILDITILITHTLSRGKRPKFHYEHDNDRIVLIDENKNDGKMILESSSKKSSSPKKRKIMNSSENTQFTPSSTSLLTSPSNKISPELSNTPTSSSTPSSQNVAALMQLTNRTRNSSSENNPENNQPGNPISLHTVINAINGNNSSSNSFIVQHQNSYVPVTENTIPISKSAENLVQNLTKIFDNHNNNSTSTTTQNINIMPVQQTKSQNSQETAITQLVNNLPTMLNPQNFSPKTTKKEPKNHQKTSKSTSKNSKNTSTKIADPNPDSETEENETIHNNFGLDSFDERDVSHIEPFQLTTQSLMPDFFVQKCERLLVRKQVLRCRKRHCKENYNTWSYNELWLHLITAHPGDYLCQSCNHVFSGLSLIRRHYQICVLGYRCTGCDKTFNKKSNLTRHHRSCQAYKRMTKLF